MVKLAIIITHPIQYYVPLFKLLAQHYQVKVFYTWGEEGANAKYDPGFKKTIAWDLPLLEGYAYEFLINTAKDPGSHHFNGIVNPSLIKAIETFEPKFILLYGWAYKSHLSALRYFKGKIPVWFRGDSTLLDTQKGVKQILKGLFLKWLYQNIDTALYVGSENKKYFKRFGVKENDLIFVPHAIDNSRFAEDINDEVKKIRATLNLKNDDTLILFAGKLERKKNPELLLQAFIELISPPIHSKKGKNLTPDLQHVHLLFVGNGELEHSLKSKVQSLESTVRLPLEESFEFGVGESNRPLSIQGDLINDEIVIHFDKLSAGLAQDDKFSRIHFMDFQNQTQMPAIYQACNLFCLPSQGPGETWGLAVNEAMAAGKAVLVSDKVGCAKDLVTTENGLIFKSNDIDDLKQKLIALTKDKASLDNMGKSAQQHIQNWSFKVQIKAIQNYAVR